MGGLGPEAQELHCWLVKELQWLISDAEGVRLRIKPAGIAVDVDLATPDVAARVLDAVRSVPNVYEGVQVIEGRAVIELAITVADDGILHP